MPAGPLIKSGDRRGKLTILGRAEGGTSRHPRYRVRCDCGNEYDTAGGTLSKAGACRKCNHGGQPRKYGDRIIAKSPLYRSWTAMRRRCNAENINSHSARWAGRGIKVCPEWNEFPAFEAWSLANGYKPGLSIDRVDNDGDYTPKNCEWVTRSVNSKRARALYRFVPIARAVPSYPYDEPCYGDF